ncbi:MAG: AAA family ATPase [bacterium]|nr:AAA family ATPase [bacterium]
MTSLVESFYGLKKPPFTTSESSGPVFMTEPLRAAAQFVRQGLEEDTSLICVSGPAGVGKSSLARSLAKLTGGAWKIASMSGHAKCWEDLRRVLLREFGIASDRITRDGLEEARQQIGKLLIVVDDAQFLSPELLERVCILPQLHTPDGQPVVQVVLFADLDGEQRDRTRPLLAWLEDGAHHKMQNLEGGEVHRYLDTRLRRAGWGGHPLITEAGAVALHRLSLGNPRRLSLACTQLLEYAATRGVSMIDAEFVVACLDDEKQDQAEPLELASGAALYDDFALELDEDWDDSLATSPLTAENINLAPSLELATPGQPVQHVVCPTGPPLESIRAVAKPPPELPQRRIYRPARSNSWRTLVILVCVATTAAALYVSQTGLGDWFGRIGMNSPFVAERFDEIDRASDTNAASLEKEDSAPGDLSAVRSEPEPADAGRALVLHGD